MMVTAKPGTLVGANESISVPGFCPSFRCIRLKHGGGPYIQDVKVSTAPWRQLCCVGKRGPAWGLGYFRISQARSVCVVAMEG